MSHRSRGRVSRGDRISASEQNEFIEAIRSQRLIPVAPIHGGGGKPLTLNRYQPFWAKLLSGTNPYAWQEVYWNGSAWTVPTGARSGTVIDHPAYEVTNVNNLAANTIVLLLEGFQGKDYRFAHLRYGTGGDNPCPSNSSQLCTLAWDIKAYCDFVAGSGHKYDPASDGYPSFLYSGATVTIETIDQSVFPPVIASYDTGSTDSHGSYCKTVGPLITDPTVAPTVDPIGGGTSGGTLPIGQYHAAYAWTNQWGQTALSPGSAAFQVGVPNPTSTPTTADPTVNPTGGGASGGSLQADTYYLKYTFKDGTGETPPSGISASFVVASGNIPRVTLPGLGSRPNATSQSIYLAADNGAGSPGPFHRYATGVTGTSFDLTTAWVNTNPAPPSSNTTAKNIPRMSVAGVVGPAAGRAYLDLGYYLTFSSLPVDLTGGLITHDLPPVGNSTGPSKFRVTVSGVGDCPSQTRDTVLSAGCTSTTLGFGFCCFKNCFSVGDFDTAAGLSPTSTCGGRGIQPLTPGSGGCTNISDIAGGLAKPSDNTFYGSFNCPNCVDNNSGAADDPNSAGGTPCIWTHCKLTQGGYWDRCVRVPSPCAVPAIVTSKTFTMKTKTAYLRNLCCGECTETPPGVDLTPEIIPKKLYLTFHGPTEIFGAHEGVSIPLDWDSSSDDGATLTHYNACQAGTESGALCSIVWDSGCLSQSIAKWWFAKTGFCRGAFLKYLFEDHEFASCRARVTQFYTLGGNNGRQCISYVSFENYFNGDCTDTPEPTPPSGAELIRGHPYCPYDCFGPSIPAGATFYGGSYAKGVFERVGLFPSFSENISMLCSPVNYSGGNNHIVDFICSGYGAPAWTYDLTE